MSTQVSLENFEEIYKSTYQNVLKYILCQCSNIEDVNDLIQNTYMDFYRILQRKGKIEVENITGFLIGIAKKKIKRHYTLLYRFKRKDTLADNEEIENIPSNVDMEAKVIFKLDAGQVWKYIKKKEMTIIKIFYLYYALDLKIADIAKELNLSESGVKNKLYRTIKELREKFKIEGDKSDE